MNQEEKGGWLSKLNWLNRFWRSLVIPVIVVVIGFMITEGKLPRIITNPPTSSVAQQIDKSKGSTSTINIADILSKSHEKETSLDLNAFLNQYKDERVVGTGTYVNLSGSSGNFILWMKVSGDGVACVFPAESEKKLKLLKLGQAVNFSGSFLGLDVTGSFFVKDCVFL